MASEDVFHLLGCDRDATGVEPFRYVASIDLDPGASDKIQQDVDHRGSRHFNHRSGYHSRLLPPQCQLCCRACRIGADVQILRGPGLAPDAFLPD